MMWIATKLTFAPLIRMQTFFALGIHILAKQAAEEERWRDKILVGRDKLRQSCDTDYWALFAAS